MVLESLELIADILADRTRGRVVARNVPWDRVSMVLGGGVSLAAPKRVEVGSGRFVPARELFSWTTGDASDSLVVIDERWLAAVVSDVARESIAMDMGREAGS